MRRLWCGIAFLTRLPVPTQVAFEAADVGKATLLFPLVGAIIGGLEAGFCFGLGAHLPPLLTAALLLGVHALLTGALHLDGLADMADGFGGGKTREDTLRIMRDHAIGAYGAIALIVVLAIKLTALAALIGSGRAERILIVAAALGRWGSVPLGRFLPYARRQEGGLGAAITDFVGPAELVGATVLAGAIAFGLGGATGGWSWLAAAGVTALVGWECRAKIGGVTGDTLGANTELTEAAIYVLAVAIG